ncbi:hypothetical protein QYF61_023874 [Mycteria americana]|uniref:Uncharacterized protein n=1 Tax=Mycteria americana TaxID=33587 RepID=A0AAN7NVT5_MYCAM|nr:hypothetical protein QYF61_023874 [Mycteria americana]
MERTTLEQISTLQPVEDPTPGQVGEHEVRESRERDVESALEDARFRVPLDLTIYGQRSHRVDLRKGLATARETPRNHPPPPAPAQKIENFLEQEPLYAQQKGQTKCSTLTAKQPQFPQLLLIRLLLQTLHQLHCPSLDTLQYLNVLLVLRGPKLNTGFKGHDYFPTPDGHTIPDTSQDAIGFLGHLGTLLAHVHPGVDQHPQVLFHQTAFQPLFPEPVALHGVVVTQVQDPALGLVKPHTIDLGPLIQPVQVPLQSLPTLKQINTPTQLGVVCKLTEGALNPLIQIIDKDVKQN